MDEKGIESVFIPAGHIFIGPGTGFTLFAFSLLIKKGKKNKPSISATLPS